MKILARTLVVACLALGANMASAIPLSVVVNTTSGGSAGNWSLFGPTITADVWLHTSPQTQTFNRTIDPGAYYFEIDGGGKCGTIFNPCTAAFDWSLLLNGAEILSDSHSGNYGFLFYDDGTFSARSVSVPEPGALSLLGLGLGILGFATRRRSQLRRSNA